MKFAGVDGVLFYGASEKPVYLYLESGKAEHAAPDGTEAGPPPRARQ